MLFSWYDLEAGVPLHSAGTGMTDFQGYQNPQRHAVQIAVRPVSRRRVTADSTTARLIAVSSYGAIGTGLQSAGQPRPQQTIERTAFDHSSESRFLGRCGL